MGLFSVLQVVHVTAAILIALLVVMAYRAISRRSRVIATIVAAAIVIRAVLGMALFWISYLELPFARGQQAGNGFWTLAIDATTYFGHAASAAQSGALLPLDHLVPSPLFIDVLAMWMMLVGTSVASAIFLNLCLYVGLAFALVRTFAPRNDWRHDLPCIVGVSSYSFSPTVLIHSTQPLKDELSAFVIAFACLGVLILGRALRRPATGENRRLATCGALVIGGATFAIAGIRWYLAVLIWSVLAAVLAVGALIGRRMSLLTYLATSAAVLVVVWLGFWAGAEPFAATLLQSRAVRAVIAAERTGAGSSAVGFGDRRHSIAELLVERVKEAREGFVAGGGNTNVAGSNGFADIGRAVPRSLDEHVMALASGLGLIFVPTTVLRAVTSVDVPGPRNLLALVDLDTTFFDVTVIAGVLLLTARRRTLGEDVPFVVFGLVLSLVLFVLIGYTITNFGTLWRMRTLAVVPLWTIVASLSPRPPRSSGRQAGAPVVAGA